MRLWQLQLALAALAWAVLTFLANAPTIHVINGCDKPSDSLAKAVCEDMAP